MTSKISVCITSYNQKHYLIEAIESVLKQTLAPTQLVIVDDNSSDGSKEIIQEYAVLYPHLITPVLHSENQGISTSRTDALTHVTEDYVTFLDGDDLFFPTKLENEYSILQKNPDAQIAFSNYQYIDEKGDYTGEWASEPPPQGNVFIDVFSRNYPKGSLYRNELVNYQGWKSIGFFDPKINLYEDYEMRIRLSYSLKTIYIDQVLCAYRKHSSGLSKAKKIKHFLALEYIYNKHYHLLKTREDKKIVDKRIRPLIASHAKKASLEAVQNQELNLSISRYWAIRYLALALKYHWQGIKLSFFIKFIIQVIFPTKFYKVAKN